LETSFYLSLGSRGSRRKIMKNFNIGGGISRVGYEMTVPGLLLPFPVLDFHYYYFLMEVFDQFCQFLRATHNASSIKGGEMEYPDS
jgi:hypothetical protein